MVAWDVCDRADHPLPAWLAAALREYVADALAADDKKTTGSIMDEFERILVVANAVHVRAEKYPEGDATLNWDALARDCHSTMSGAMLHKRWGQLKKYLPKLPRR